MLPKEILFKTFVMSPPIRLPGFLLPVSSAGKLTGYDATEVPHRCRQAL